MLLPIAVPFPKVAGSTGEDSANGSGRQGGSGGSGKDKGSGWGGWDGGGEGGGGDGGGGGGLLAMMISCGEMSHVAYMIES